MELLALLAGLAGLWLGTELTIHGAVAVAERLDVPEFIVGLTVLSIGSDLPELAIAVDAAIWNLRAGEASDVVVGSALGSCLGQIGFVLGITGLIGFLKLPKKVVYQQGSMLLARSSCWASSDSTARSHELKVSFWLLCMCPTCF